MEKKYTHPQPDCPNCRINQGLIQRAVDGGINVCPSKDECKEIMSVYLSFGKGGKPLDEFTKEEVISILDKADVDALGL